MKHLWQNQEEHGSVLRVGEMSFVQMYLGTYLEWEWGNKLFPSFCEDSDASGMCDADTKNILFCFVKDVFKKKQQLKLA